jgi:hypothetical protein
MLRTASISGNSWHRSLIGKQRGVGRPAISRSVGHTMDESEDAVPRPTSSTVAIHRNMPLLLIRNTCYKALRKLISTTIRIKKYYMLVSFISFYLSSCVLSSLSILLQSKVAQTVMLATCTQELSG